MSAVDFDGARADEQTGADVGARQDLGHHSFRQTLRLDSIGRLADDFEILLAPSRATSPSRTTE